MADRPLCPVVLSLLAVGPRRVHEVARALASTYPAALVALERLRSAGLVRQRFGAAYAITRRGRSELALQRGLWALSAANRPHCPVHRGDLARTRPSANFVRSSTAPAASTRTRVQSPAARSTHPRPAESSQ